MTWLQKIFLDTSITQIRNFSCTAKNKFTYRIKLDFWGRHPSRNQMQKKQSISVELTKDEIINELYFEIPGNVKSSFVSYVSNFITWYTPYAIVVAELASDINQLNNDILAAKAIIDTCQEKIIYLSEKIKNVYHWYSTWLLKFRNSRLKNNEYKLEITKDIQKKYKETLSQTTLKWKKATYTLNHWKERKINYIDSHKELQFENINDYLTRIYKKKNRTHNTVHFQEDESLQNETKGVYIIQNATRNKFYVGQSKNIEKRISCQHFQKGNCMNQAFMDDYNNSDIFNIAIVPCKTRDELDELEKHYINEFDSFGKGYNKTGGNI